ncbi:30S ribosomal protein S3 [Candidatus Micrarchaeota archaeon]|nr:30S ribosomal protein S3 [Candidatus Micrarchaeota archaeon]
MLYEEKIIEEPLNRYKLMKFLEKRLDRAGLASVDIQRTPIMTRITLEVMNPARIIGRKGRFINEFTEIIKREFKIDNPQISVIEVREPYLEPRMVGKKATKYIETGKKVRAVLHFMLREIMRAGAIGAEIVASGKIGAKGARAKRLRVSAGYIPKAGEPTRLIKVAHITANTKSGVIGVLVRIAPPGTVFPDKKVAEKIALPKVIETATEIVYRGREEEGEKKKEEKKPVPFRPGGPGGRRR